MKVSKNAKYQTHKKNIKLTKNQNDRTGAPGAARAGPCPAKRGALSDFLTSIVAKHQNIDGDGPFGENFCFRKKPHNAEQN